jgi:8-oxo-dGTP pyrophosphatase MutT (NUDIX family)
MPESNPFPVICILVCRLNANDELEILIQRRTKQRPHVDYSKFWELPQGKVITGESLLEAVERELREETGLELQTVDSKHGLLRRNMLGTTIEYFQPLLCTLDLESSFIGLGIIVTATGHPTDTSEASGHKWVTKNEAIELIEQEMMFPLNVPIVLNFFELEGRHGVSDRNRDTKIDL